MRTGWVKLPRDFLDFEYYKDAQTKAILIHLLLTAEYSPRRLHGVELDAGEALTTVKELAAKTGASTSQTRTALTRLQRAGKIAIKTTNKFSVITLINAGFQDDNEPEISKQNGKAFEKENANKTQSKLPAFRKPSLSDKKEEKKEENKKLNSCATVDDLIDDVPAELLEGELTDEEAEKLDDNCRQMLAYVGNEEVVNALCYFDEHKTKLEVADVSDYLQLCKITDRVGFRSVKSAIDEAIIHNAKHAMSYICEVCGQRI